MQQLKKLMLIGISISMLSLSACMTVPPDDDAQSAQAQQSNTNVAGQDADSDSGTQTFGVGGVKHFTEAQLSQYGFVNGKPTNQTYYFDFDSNQVRSADYDSIAAQAQYLRDNPNMHVVLEGNTDSRGSREYNIALGERRALSVLNVLGFDGVAKNQIRWVSYGQEKPALNATGHTESDYQKNRRVNLVYEENSNV